MCLFWHNAWYNVMKNNNRNVDKLFKLGINCCLMFWGNNKCFCFVSLLMSKGDVLLHCYSTVVTMLLIFIFFLRGAGWTRWSKIAWAWLGQLWLIHSLLPTIIVGTQLPSNLTQVVFIADTHQILIIWTKDCKSLIWLLSSLLFVGTLEHLIAFIRQL